MEEQEKYIEKAGHVNITQNARTGEVITTDNFSIDPTNNAVTPSTEEASMQLLQRGFIIPGTETSEYGGAGVAQGGPIDVADIIDEVTVSLSTGEPNFNEVTELFSNIGNLYFGKKVYIKNLRKYYYFSKDRDWKEIR